MESFDQLTSSLKFLKSMIYIVMVLTVSLIQQRDIPLMLNISVLWCGSSGMIELDT